MRRIMMLLLLAVMAASAGAWDWSGTSQSKLWSAQPGNALSLCHLTDLRFWGNLKSGWDWEGGLRYELDQESWDDTSHYRGFPRKYLRLSGSLGSLTVGDYFATLGRGIVLNCIEEKRTGTERDLEGADIQFSLSDLLELRLLGGWRRQNAALDTTRTFAGGQAGLALWRRLKLNAIYLRANAGYKKQAEVFGRPVEEIYGGAVQMGYGPVEVYSEFDVRHTFGQLLDPSLGWQGKEDIKGQASYVSALFTLKGFGLSVDAKDYRRFDTEYNAPPAVNREGWLLNAGYDEKGYQVQATASPFSAVTLTASHSWAESRHDYLWPYLAHSPDDSIGKYRWKDYYLETKIQARENLSLTAEAYRRSEKNLQPDVKLRYYNGGGLEIVWRYGFQASLTLDGSYRLYDNRYIDGGLKYEAPAAEFKWSPFSAISFFGSGELASRRVPEYEYQKRWGEVGAEVSFANDSQHIIISVGQTKGGLVCSGGFCRFEPSFRGLKASWEWRY